MYVTNIPSEYVSKGAIHNFYSSLVNRKHFLNLEIIYSYSSQYKYKKGTVRMSYLWKINCALIIFSSNVSDATITTDEKTKRT